MPFRFERLGIPDLFLITAKAFEDPRGFFMETHKQSEFAANGISQSFVQGNFSRSSYGVLRGLHYQLSPKAQGKLVNVIRGEIFDVAVDMRRGSPSFAKWVGVKISAEDFQLIYVPAGFAHGFCVVSDEADVAYMVTEEYAPEADRGIAWNDPALGIAWPVEDPILSKKDSELPGLDDGENNFSYVELPR
jgi:dTDP-4-dehydrorhamnose 3,5-epimerase